MVGFPLDVQKQQGGIDNYTASMGKQKGRGRTEQPRGLVIDGGSDGVGEPECDADGTSEGSDVEVLTREGFFRRPPRLQGNKAAKSSTLLLAKRESALQAQA